MMTLRPAASASAAASSLRTPLAKSTFYFVLAVLVVVDIVQSRYQKKLALRRERGFDT